MQFKFRGLQSKYLKVSSGFSFVLLFIIRIKCEIMHSVIALKHNIYCVVCKCITLNKITLCFLIANLFNLHTTHTHTHQHRLHFISVNR